jgi:hypothetical protein
MSKPLRAVRGFRYPDGDANLELAKAGELEKVKWVHVEAGTGLDEPKNPELMQSWIDNGVVELVPAKAVKS